MKAKNLRQASNALDKMDPFVVVALKPGSNSARTTTKNNAGTNADWDEIVKVAYDTDTMLAAGRAGQTPVVSVRTKHNRLYGKPQSRTNYGYMN